MNTTPEQTKEIATRLGLTEPVAPKMVAEYLDYWEAHNKAVSDYERPRLNGYYYKDKFSQLDGNLAEVTKGIEVLEKLKAQMEYLNRHRGEMVALATVTYENQVEEFWKAIRAEAERPRREFETAKATFIGNLEKEIRSLKSRITRANKRRFENPTGATGAATQLDIAQMCDRQSVAEWLLDEASRMHYDINEMPDFTEEAIFALAVENAQYYGKVFTRFQDRLAEASKAGA